jgi:PPOX class probable F420-dependent enzyme
MAEPTTHRPALTPDQHSMLEETIYATVTTLHPDGSPHTTVVWVDGEGGDVRFNTAVGRIKERNLRRDPRVSVALFDPADPHRGLVVRGRAELTEDGAVDHVERLSWKYDGHEYRDLRPGDRRVTVRVRADRVSPVS